MKLLNGGDLIAMTLAQEGVELFIGIVGGQLLPLFDAVGRDRRLRLVVPRNEAAGAMMADGYSRSSRRVSVNMSTVGAGIIYAAAGTGYAWGDHVPIISISPQVQTWKMYPAQESLQGCYQGEMMRGITRWNCIIYNWKRIPQLIGRAVREAISGEMGPVHVDVPVDVFYEFHPVTERRLKRLLPPPGSSYFTGGYLPDRAALREVISAMEASERPVIVAGTCVMRQGAWDALAELAKRFQAPVLCTQGALSAMTGEDSSYVGVLGHEALPVTESVLEEADLVIALGTTLEEMGELADRVDEKGTTLVQASPEPEKLGVFPEVKLGLAADASSLCRSMVVGLKEESSARASWARSCREEYLRSCQTITSDAKGDRAGSAILALGNAIYGRDRLVLDGKTSFYWGSVLCPAGTYNSRYFSPGMAGIGYGLPMAMGVKLAFPGERVIALCDSEALFHHLRELETSRRENIPVVVAVVGEPYDWKSVAEGFGVRGYKVTSEGELLVAMKDYDAGVGTVVMDLTEFGP
ncbi:MAG: thiamine pyrophosphate-binding protein [Candidatus Geothermincolales bacterium]